MCNIGWIIGAFFLGGFLGFSVFAILNTHDH